MTSEQESSARDKLWNAAYLKWYDAYLNETIANRLVSRWQAFSDPAKAITAITASGSVIAGWTLWNSPGYKTLWILLAGTGAVLSVISTSLTVPERIKDWTSTRSDFSHIRVSFEVLLTRMKLHPDFDINDSEKTLETLSIQFGSAADRMRNDLLHTDRLDKNCKTELDGLISAKKLWS